MLTRSCRWLHMLHMSNVARHSCELCNLFDLFVWFVCEICDVSGRIACIINVNDGRLRWGPKTKQFLRKGSQDPEISQMSRRKLTRHPRKKKKKKQPTLAKPLWQPSPRQSPITNRLECTPRSHFATHRSTFLENCISSLVCWHFSMVQCFSGGGWHNAAPQRHGLGTAPKIFFHLPGDPQDSQGSPHNTWNTPVSNIFNFCSTNFTPAWLNTVPLIMTL